MTTSMRVNVTDESGTTADLPWISTAEPPTKLTSAEDYVILLVGLSKPFNSRCCLMASNIFISEATS